MASHQLELHPEKTRIVNSTSDPNGFDFLGYTFKKGMRLVRKKSLTTMRDKIRLHTRRSQGVGITTVIGKLNPILRGWFNYFKHVKRSELKAKDGFVRRRLRSILRKYQKKGGGQEEISKTISTGQMPTSRAWGFSQCMKPMRKRTDPDEETIDWRAVCGRTARTVRREGRVDRLFSTPIVQWSVLSVVVRDGKFKPIHGDWIRFAVFGSGNPCRNDDLGYY